MGRLNASFNTGLFHPKLPISFGPFPRGEIWLENLPEEKTGSEHGNDDKIPRECERFNSDSDVSFKVGNKITGFHCDAPEFRPISFDGCASYFCKALCYWGFSYLEYDVYIMNINHCFWGGVSWWVVSWPVMNAVSFLCKSICNQNL